MADKLLKNNSTPASEAAPEAPVPAPSTPAPEAAPSVQAPEAAPSTPAPGFTLCINCLPTKGLAYLDADQILANVLTEYKAARGIEHYKLEDFGKGPGAFAAAVGELLDTAKLPDVIYLSTRSPEGADALLAFTARASVVVRGL